MSLPEPSRISAVLFDYGNTLVEFGARQIEQCEQALARVLERRFGPFDQERFVQLQEEGRLAPYLNRGRESDLVQLSVEMVHRLYGRAPSPAELDEILEVRQRAFVEAVQAEPGTLELLGRLSGRYALGLVSNYPSGAIIRASLERTRISEYLKVVVVSGDVGFAKPDPRPFETALAALGVARAEAIHVGDNWVADIQGAKRIGLAAVQICRWTPAEWFDPQPGDHEPDLVIEHLAELGPVLLSELSGSRCRPGPDPAPSFPWRTSHQLPERPRSRSAGSS